MVRHVLDRVCDVADEVLVSIASGATERYSVAVGQKVTIVEDEKPGMGPLEGLRLAFQRAKGEYVLVAPCDTPFVNAEVLSLLARRAIGRGAAVPVVRGYLEPLLAAYRRSDASMAFEKELVVGRGKMGNAVAHLDVNQVPENDILPIDPLLRSFWNINSSEDLARAEEVLRDMMITGRTTSSSQ